MTRSPSQAGNPLLMLDKTASRSPSALRSCLRLNLILAVLSSSQIRAVMLPLDPALLEMFSPPKTPVQLNASASVLDFTSLNSSLVLHHMIHLGLLLTTLGASHLEMGLLVCSCAAPSSFLFLHDIACASPLLLALSLPFTSIPMLLRSLARLRSASAALNFLQPNSILLPRNSACLETLMLALAPATPGFFLTIQSVAQLGNPVAACGTLHLPSFLSASDLVYPGVLSPLQEYL